jgi:uncharacterized Zn-binding protein involved in type VI secretion
MAKPASRIGDPHICPTPNHVGGPVVAPGEPSVRIVGLPAARFTDMASCVGPIDAISMGSPTVIVGKLLAARVTEATEHKGLVTGGSPLVLIGDPPPWVTVVRRGKMLIVVDRKAHKIRIVGVQEFKGDGASDDYIAKATDCINNTWGGPTTFEGEPYDVDSMVTGRRGGDPANPLGNQIGVKQTTDPPSVTTSRDPSNQAMWGNGSGYQHSTDADDGNVVPAHEFGHSMGLGDEYVEGPKTADGNRTITRTGPPGGLMGYIDPGSRPTPGNFDELINGKKPKAQP